MIPAGKFSTIAVLAALAWAQLPYQISTLTARKARIDRGVVKLKDPSLRLLVICSGPKRLEHSYQWTGESVFTNNGRRIEIDELKLGDRISIEHLPGVGGLPVIRRARLRPRYPQLRRHPAGVGRLR